MRAATMRAAQEELLNDCICETCAERGRPNEPVYKMGMCKFCYYGLPHPKATPEQLATEKMGAYKTYKRPPLSPFPEESLPRLACTLASRTNKSGNKSALLTGWYLVMER